MPKHKGGRKWKPSGINAYDPVKYLFYNHSECGSKALNPLSPFFEVGIRDYLRNKPRTTSPVIKKIAADLEKDAIAVFSIRHSRWLLSLPRNVGRALGRN